MDERIETEDYILEEGGRTLWTVKNKRLTELRVPEGVECLAATCCAGMNLNKVILPESLKTIYNYAFQKCKISQLYLSEITYLDTNIFEDATVEEIFFGGSKAGFDSISKQEFCGISDAGRRFFIPWSWGGMVKVLHCNDADIIYDKNIADLEFSQGNDAPATIPWL